MTPISLSVLTFKLAVLHLKVVKTLTRLAVKLFYVPLALLRHTVTTP